MPVVNLTDRSLKAIKPVPGKQVDYFDANVKGLALRVSPGGTQTFILMYSRPGHKTRQRLKLGTYPDLSLAEARQKARDHRVQVQEGLDPKREKAAALQSESVRDLVEDYIKRHVSKQRSADDTARRLRRNVTDVIGDLKLTELRRRDLARCVQRVVDRGKETQANRVFANIRGMMNWAVSVDILETDVMAKMKAPSKPKVRTRVLSPEEIKIVWSTLPSASMEPATQRLLKLCLITGQRVGEIAGMRHDELDLENAVWSLPAERVKNDNAHSVPLSSLAIEVITEQLSHLDDYEQRLDKPHVPWLFPSPLYDAPITSAAVGKAILRQKVTRDTEVSILGILPWTAHDLRRTMATEMQRLGVSVFTIGHVLNHRTTTKSSVTTLNYGHHKYEREKRDALALWANRLSAIANGSAAQIVNLRSP